MKTKFLSIFVIFVLLLGKFSNAFDASNNDSLYQDITDYGDESDSNTQQPTPNLGNMVSVKILDLGNKPCEPCICDTSASYDSTSSYEDTTKPNTRKSNIIIPKTLTPSTTNPCTSKNVDEFDLWPLSLPQTYMAVIWTTLGMYWFLSAIIIASMFIFCYPKEMKKLSNSASIVTGQSKTKSGK